MKLNDLAEIKDLRDFRGYDEWSVDLKFRKDDVLFPWDVTITDPKGKEFTSKGGSPEEAYQKARFAARI